jgi:hypothetical protein
VALGWASCMRRSDCTFQRDPAGLLLIESDSSITRPGTGKTSLSSQIQELPVILQSTERWGSQAVVQGCIGRGAQRIRDRPGWVCSTERTEGICGTM